MAVCNKCNGKGICKCTKCNGKGVITIKDISFISYTGAPFKVTKNCPACGGKGWKKCTDCRGTGETKDPIENEKEMAL